MKRIVLSILSAIGIAAMLLSLKPLSYLARPMSDNRDNASGFYAEEPNSMDMVYIGGSATYMYWQPLRVWNQSGYTSFNFAHAMMTPEAVKYCIMEVQKTQQPLLYVVDLRPFQYGEEPYFTLKNSQTMYYEVPIRNGTDVLNYSALRWELIDHSVRSPFDRLPYYFDLLLYHRNMVDLLAASVFDGEHGRAYRFIDNIEMHPYKGFCFNDNIEPLEFSDFSAVEEQTQIPEAVDELFIDLLEYCRAEKLQVLFVVHAYIQKEADKREFNYMKSCIEDYGFDFLNANDYWQEIGLDYSVEMADGNHVNAFGAEKYTDFLNDYIVSHYELPDHRGNPAFDAWNTLYESFAEDAVLEKQKLADSLETSVQGE